MIRSLETVVPADYMAAETTAMAKNVVGGTSEECSGWGPEVIVLNESEMKKYEKWEERDLRMKKRTKR